VKIKILFCIILMLTLSVKANESINWNNETLNWFSYEDGLKEMKKTGKKGILLIYADWCSTCKNYSTYFKDDVVIDKLSEFILIKTNHDQEPSISEKYSFDTKYVPKTIALESDGLLSKLLYPKTKDFMFYIPIEGKHHLINFLKSAQKI